MEGVSNKLMGYMDNAFSYMFAPGVFSVKRNTSGGGLMFREMVTNAHCTVMLHCYLYITHFSYYKDSDWHWEEPAEEPKTYSHESG